MSLVSSSAARRRSRSSTGGAEVELLSDVPGLAFGPACQLAEAQIVRNCFLVLFWHQVASSWHALPAAVSGRPVLDVLDDDRVLCLINPVKHAPLGTKPGAVESG